MSAKLATIDVTFMGHFIVALDTFGQVYCFKNNFILNEQASSPVSIVNLLEYCMVSGIDTLDILLNLKGQMIDTIVDKFSDNFNR